MLIKKTISTLFGALALGTIIATPVEAKIANDSRENVANLQPGTIVKDRLNPFERLRQSASNAVILYAGYLQKNVEGIASAQIGTEYKTNLNKIANDYNDALLNISGAETAQAKQQLDAMSMTIGRMDSLSARMQVTMSSEHGLSFDKVGNAADAYSADAHAAIDKFSGFIGNLVSKNSQFLSSPEMKNP